MRGWQVCQKDLPLEMMHLLRFIRDLVDSDGSCPIDFGGVSRFHGTLLACGIGTYHKHNIEFGTDDK